MSVTRTPQGLEDERRELGEALPAYEIGDVLGRGSFAVVYAARHIRLEREVAVKRLSRELLGNGEAGERFAAEARTLALLDHPHVVRVHDYVEQGDVYALVMERLHGGTLAERLRVGSVPRARGCAFTVATLHGLEHAHQHGILHRDIKPANLLFGNRDLVKVADFGIAKVVGANAARMTATGLMLGTPAFMAPEQASRSVGPISAATDVWAVGTLLYELLSGELPFGGDGGVMEVLTRRVMEDPRQLRAVAPDVPEELAEVVMHALERDPAERWPTAGAFADALESASERAFAEGLRTTGVPIHRTDPRPAGAEAPTVVESASVDLIPAARAPGPEPVPAGRRRRGLIAALAAAAVAALAAGVALVLAGGDDGGRTALPPAPPGWPKTLSLGFIDTVDGPAGAARRLGKGGNTFQVFYGDAAAGEDWSKDPSQGSPARFVRDAHRAGLFPYTVYYQLRALGQSGRGDDPRAPELLQTLRSARLMGIYWRNVRRFLKEVGSTDRAAAVSLDSNFWSYLEQHLAVRGGRADTVPAKVGVTGLPELRGIPDNLVGIAKGWRALRDRYAPEVLLGYEFDDWAAADIDIARDGPPIETVVNSARQAAEFFLFVGANELDFGALTVNGDGAQEGQAPNAKYVYSPSEKEALVAFVREFVRVTGIPMVLEGVPVGNTVTKAITDKDFHWRDSWVQWLIGSDDFTGLRKLHDAGVIGVMFGVSFAEGETCPCDAAQDGVTNAGKYAKRSNSADDDGGYFADRVRALRKAGGLPLP